MYVIFFLVLENCFCYLSLFFPRTKIYILRNTEWVNSLYLKAEGCAFMFWLDGAPQKSKNPKNKPFQTNQLMLASRSNFLNLSDCFTLRFSTGWERSNFFREIYLHCAINSFNKEPLVCFF